MKRNVLILFAAAFIVCAGSAFGANQIFVNDTAAMGPDNGGTACNGGNCGLEVVFDGSTNPAKVVDDTPNNESLYRAEFYMNFDDLDLAEGNFISVIRGTEVTLFRASFQMLVIRKFGIYRIFLRAGTNSPGVFRFSPRINLADNTGPVLFRIEFEQSPAPATPGGEVTATVLDCGGCPAEGDFINTAQISGVGVNNNQLDVDDLHAGGVGNLTIGTVNGSLYFDEFASFRTLAAVP